MVSAEGRTTQKTYDRVATSFLKSTRSTELGAAWLERFVCALPPAALVADLGSGPGRDAALLRARGLRAICADRSLGMLRAGVDEYPAPRTQGDLLALPIRSASVAGVWANACLLHLSRDELPRALAEIRRVLAPPGVLHLTLKRGSGSEWESSRYGQPRWFQYWLEDDLDALLLESGFRIEASETRESKSAVWLARLCALR